MLTTIALMAPYTILQNVFSSDLPDQKLSSSTSGCDNSTFPSQEIFHKNWKDSGDSAGIKMLSMSYMWYAGLTTSLTVFFGIIFTFLHRKFYPNDDEVLEKVNYKCISPPLLRFWKRFVPKVAENVQYSDDVTKDS